MLFHMQSTFWWLRWYKKKALIWAAPSGHIVRLNNFQHVVRFILIFCSSFCPVWSQISRSTLLLELVRAKCNVVLYMPEVLGIFSLVAHHICNVDFLNFYQGLTMTPRGSSKMPWWCAPPVTVAFWYMNTKLIKHNLFSKNGEALASAWIDTYINFYFNKSWN
jgi:hypothetical protein